MRLYVTLIITAICLAFASGYFALSLQGPFSPTSDDVVEITRLKTDFQQQIPPKAIINFNSIYYSEGKLQLLDPIFTVPEDGQSANTLYSSSDDCFQNLGGLLNRLDFEKVWIWEEYRCSKRKYLPEEFFERSPFMHPSGLSFAYLAFESGKANFHTRDWAIKHLPYFHVSELARITEEIGPLGGIYGVLEKLGPDSLTSIIKGQGTVLTRDYLLARLKYPSRFSVLEYRVYSRDDLERFLRNTSYRLSNYREGQTCFYRDGQICWEYNLRHVFQLANRGTLLLFLGFSIIVVLVVRILLVRIKNQRFEDEKRRLALKVLTHEFRTPVTSLLLLVERMNKKYDSMDDDLQDCFLRMSSEVYRLQRLTEMSHNYLNARKAKKLIQFNKEKVNSLNQFVAEFIEPYQEKYGDQIKLEPLHIDSDFCLDSYWFPICFKNLIENAIFHGALPITIRLLKNGDKVSFQVEDQGECSFDSLEELTSEFVKGNKSSGTGLGLNIVKKVIDEMKGKLTFEKNPTRFTITLSQTKERGMKETLQKQDRNN